LLPSTPSNALLDLESRRLEEKYIRRKDRGTFVSQAVYVDGEYVYPLSQISGASKTSTDLRQSPTAIKAQKKDKRWSQSWNYKGAIPSAGNWKW